MALQIGLDAFYNFIEGDRYNEFKFKEDLISAIENDTDLFFGQSSFYNLNGTIPLVDKKEKNNNEITILKIIEHMNKLATVPDIEISIAKSLEHIIPGVKMTQLSMENKKFWSVQNSENQRYKFVSYCAQLRYINQYR